MKLWTKRTEINLNTLLPCFCKKYPFKRCNLTVLWCHHMQWQQRQLQGFFAVAAVWAGGGIPKCGKKKQGNGCSDSKNIQIKRDKNPRGLLLIAVGGAASSIKAGGVSWETNSATLKIIAMLMAPCSTIINREMADINPRPYIGHNREPWRSSCCDAVGGENVSKDESWHIA